MSNIQEPADIIFQQPLDSNTIISLEDARSRHLTYLQEGPYIYTSEKGDVAGGDVKVLHSFSINQDDLNFLCQFAAEGIRLHFCKESSGNLNIIAVPIGRNGELNLGDLGIKRMPIANTLEPCPSICAPLFSEKSLNCWCENGKYYWMDPNDVQDGKMWFIRNDDGTKEYVDKPASAPLVPQSHD